MPKPLREKKYDHVPRNKTCLWELRTYSDLGINIYERDIQRFPKALNKTEGMSTPTDNFHARDIDHPLVLPLMMKRSDAIYKWFLTFDRTFTPSINDWSFHAFLIKAYFLYNDEKEYAQIVNFSKTNTIMKYKHKTDYNFFDTFKEKGGNMPH